jgi:hypothetical protein
MTEHETKVAFGMAGFWAGILLGLVLFGFPVRALSLPASCCTVWPFDQQVSGWQMSAFP